MKAAVALQGVGSRKTSRLHDVAHTYGFKAALTTAAAIAVQAGVDLQERLCIEPWDCRRSCVDIDRIILLKTMLCFAVTKTLIVVCRC